MLEVPDRDSMITMMAMGRDPLEDVGGRGRSDSQAFQSSFGTADPVGGWEAPLGSCQ